MSDIRIGNRPPGLDQKVLFLVGNAGRNIVTGPRLLYSQGSAQKHPLQAALELPSMNLKLQLSW